MPILFSFIPVNVTLLLFPSRTCTTTNTTTTTTDDEKTNRNVWCSLISLSLLLSFLPELSYGFLFLSILSCFFLPRPFFLSLFLFYLPGSFGAKTKNQILRALDDKRTREKKKRKRKTKLTSAI